MAIFRESPLCPGISGKMAAVVFKSVGNRSVVARSATTPNKASELQQLNRQRFHATVVYWRDLSAAQRLMWRNTARNHRRINRLGQTIVPTGFQLFQVINAGRLAAGLPLLPEPPPNFTPLPLDEPFEIQTSLYGHCRLYWPTFASGTNTRIHWRLARTFSESRDAAPALWSPWIVTTYSTPPAYVECLTYSDPFTGTPATFEYVHVESYLAADEWLPSQTQHMASYMYPPTP